MAASTLLKDLENLDHIGRVKRMVQFGKQSKDNERARATINNLTSGSLYEQALVLETCYGSRDISVAQQALALSSKHLKKRALHVIGLLGTDDELLQALRKAPPILQIHTLRRFRDARRHRQRLHVIESYLEELEKSNRDPALFQQLLPLGSGETLDRHLSRLLDYFTLLDWSHLAKYHPEITQKVLLDWIDRSSEDDHQLVTTLKHVTNKWLTHDYHIDYAVELFKLGQKKISMKQFPVKDLAAKRPREVFRIVLDSDEQVEEDFLERVESKTLRQLPLAQFLEVFKRYPDVIDLWRSPTSFDELTFEQRKALYKTVNVGWRGQGGVLTRLSLDRLPTEDRIKEARRHIGLSKFVTSPEGKIEYIAMLPWSEAMELQTPFLRSSDVDTRSSAIKYQISGAKFDGSHLSDALQLALALKNEQDPVKREMMTGLAEIPPSRWKEGHLNDLKTVLRNLLDTSDTSSVTLSKAVELVTGILSFHPQWASKQLATIIQERNPSMRRFELSGNIPVRDVMAIVAQEMSPVLQNLLAKKNGDSLQSIAVAFGDATKYWSEILGICEKVLNDPEMDKNCDFMLSILKQYQPRTWSRVIPSLLQDNRDTAYGREVMHHIHSRQQNLIWSYLKAGGDFKRRSRDGLKHLRSSSHGFWRWTSAQQQGYAEILLAEINDPDLESDEKTASIKQLSALSFVDTAYVINFASDDDRPIVQEAALKSLGKLDGGQGVPVLIEALSDKRARIAIYALRTVLKSMPKDELFSLLKLVPQTKITVAKETLRLIGELENDEAFKYLLERSKEKLHVDVRLALFRALQSFTDRDETWELFQRTVEDPESDIAKIVATVPEDGLSTKSKKRLLKLLIQLLSHPDPVVRVATLERCSNNPLSDPDNLLAPRLFEFVHSTLDDEAENASEAIFKTYASSNINLIRNTYRKLMSNRGRLSFFHDKYWFIAYGRNKKFNPVTHMILKVLKEDRFSIKRRVKLMFEALYWDEIQPYFFEILPELHADALVETEGFIEENTGRWKREKDSLLEAELEMRKSKDEKVRRLALSLLIGGVDEEKGWKRAEKDRLEVYKNDESALVAEKAWEVVIDEESNDLDGEEDEST